MDGGCVVRGGTHRRSQIAAAENAMADRNATGENAMGDRIANICDGSFGHKQ